MRVLQLCVVVTCAFFLTKDVRADVKSISLGEVSAVHAEDASMTPKLEAAVRDELGRLDLSHARKQAILSVSIVQIQSEKRTSSSRNETITCVVSATLRNPKSGAVFAVLEGHARAEGESRRSLETSAMRGAVHGATSRLLEALQ